MASRRLTIALMVVLLALVFVAGCGGGATTTTAAGTSTTQQGSTTTQAATTTTGAAKEVVFRYGVAAAPTSLDPHVLYGNASIELAENLFDGLTLIDSNMQIKPAIAESWAISSDGLVYTFKLRKDVKYSNGDPVTAEDFKYSWNRALDPKLGNPHTFMMDLIKGAKDVIEGKATEATGIVVKDPYTFEVTLDFPAGYFLSLTTRWPYWVVNKKAIDTFGDQWTQPGNLVGTGAYTLEEAVEEDHYTFRANPAYFLGKPAVDKATAYIIPEASTQLLKFEGGELDAMVSVDPANLQQIKADPKLSKLYTSVPQLRTTWIGMRLSMAPFKDNLALREALAHAIDRQKLVEVALGGLGAPATSFLPPGMPAHNKDLDPFKFDVTLAKQKLAEAGYADGKGFPKVEILIRADTENQKVFEFVQAQFKENLGIDVALNAVPNKTYAAMKNDPNQRPPMFRNAMGADYPDPQEFLEYFGITGSGQNQEEFSNPKFDELVQQGNKSTNQDERIKLYQEAEKLYLADIPIIPLYYASASWLLSDKFTGFGFSPLYLKPLADVKPAK